jgi:hypothetical protein
MRSTYLFKRFDWQIVNCATINNGSKNVTYCISGFQKGWVLSLVIAKDRKNFWRGRDYSLSFAMKRDKKGIKAITFGSLLYLL